VGFKANLTALQKKLTQDLVAGNSKSVMRQERGGMLHVVLIHLRGATAALTPNIPGMLISVHNAWKPCGVRILLPEFHANSHF
jgi:hypothetical protein